MRRPLTVGRLARHARLPVRSFARQFREETDVSPMRWLTVQRLHEARRLLEATELPVEAVAAESGFGSAATLRTHFARELGTTPTQYRKRHRAGS
ncbi:hypothetical protein GCM10025867_15860 [Frondihabitans sucicola]|uniref:HTH araC/xylS-type domain-containing protein n=1 Tax=Frondihabitans sucicola TaxID=1268041 RepID=A0ABM8GLR0_9MICO|nr:helix-turn-helix domain-containing protein [Frondihabitans sucicola]BDZ49345.1 hypothetical protein GCM10025867_15860 [Frondihabitans sucicola]